MATASPEHLAASGVSTAGGRAAWVGVAIACTVAVGYPLWVSLVFHGDFTDLANEPIAYRYFFVERVRSGEHMVVGVGYLLSALQQAVYSLMQASTPEVFADLRAAVNRFSYLTNAAILLLQSSVLIAAAVSSRLWAMDRAIVFAVGLLLTFGFGFAGFDYALMPDYYHLNMALAQLLLLIFLLNLRDIHRVPRPSWLVLCSLIAGAAIADKISILPLAAVALAPVMFAGSARLSPFLRRGLAMASIAVMGFGAVHLLAYNGHLSHVRAMIPVWLSFVANPGGEPNFWANTFRLHLWTYNYAYYGLVFIFVVVVIAIAVLRDSRRDDAAAALYLVSLFAGAFYVYAIFKRPAGTTLFESSQWLGCLAAMLLALEVRLPWVTRIGVAIAALLGLLTLWTFPIGNAMTMVRQSGARADQKQQFFLRTLQLAKHRPMIVLFKDNSLHHEGFHELLLKGASDFPTWKISRGSAVVAKYAGPMEFRSEAERRPSIGGPVDGNAVLVVFQAVSGDDALARYPGARAFAARPGIAEEKWLLRSKGAAEPTVLGRIFYPVEQQPAVNSGSWSH